jgi:lysozyme family protein
VFSRMDILGFWQKCQITPSRLSEAKFNAEAIIANKSQYDAVCASTNVPFYVTGVIHMREASFNFKTYLGNGDSLNRPSVHVPKGRGPFKTWYDGAIDAFHLDHFDKLPSGSHWDIVTALIKLEMYNGGGYNSKGVRSPYVWAGTNMQQRGKYVADGHYDPNAWDSQPGCAEVLLALKQFHGVDLNEG